MENGLRLKCSVIYGHPVEFILFLDHNYGRSVRRKGKPYDALLYAEVYSLSHRNMTSDKGGQGKLCIETVMWSLGRCRVVRWKYNLGSSRTRLGI